MSNGIFTVPVPTNEPVLDYAPGSPERREIRRSAFGQGDDAAFGGMRVDVTGVPSGRQDPHARFDMVDLRPDRFDRADIRIAQAQFAAGFSEFADK